MLKAKAKKVAGKFRIDNFNTPKARPRGNSFTILKMCFSKISFTNPFRNRIYTPDLLSAECKLFSRKSNFHPQSNISYIVNSSEEHIFEDELYL